MTSPVLLRQPYTGWLERQPATSRRVPQQEASRRFLHRHLVRGITRLGGNRLAGWQLGPGGAVRQVPDWAQNPPEPWPPIRQGIDRLRDGIQKEEWLPLGAAVVAAYVAWSVLTWQPWMPTLTVTLLWLTAVAYGLGTAWLCHADAAPWRWTHRTAIAATCVWFVVGLVGILTETLAFIAVGSVAVVQAFAYRPVGEKADAWWSHHKLATAFVTAKILNKPVDADLPTLHYLGKPGRRDATGAVWVTVNMPPGATYDQARKRHGELASALGLPADNLHLEHDRTQPGSAVTIAVLPNRDLAPITADLPERTDWRQPVRLGLDRLGRPVDLRTTNVQTAFVGQTGSGKTRLARLFVAHAILDPRVPLACFSFKDDEEDWAPMRPLCEDRYVGGTTRKSLERAVELLTHIEAISEYRGGLRRADRQPMVVVVDEWARAVKAADRYDPTLAKTLGSLFAELAATTRSREIHLVTTWQRGTVTYIDGDLRANLIQKAVGTTTKESETRYVLDCVPQALPSAPGEFLVNIDDGEPTLTRVPNLDDDTFVDICDRGLALRKAEPHPPVLPSGDQTAPVVPHQDPFTDAVRAILEVGPMTPTALRASLPEDMRGTSAKALATRLASVGDVEAGWGGEGGKRRVYRLTSRRDDVSRALDAAFHAQADTAVGMASEASVQP